MHYTPEKAELIIKSCAALHNICLQFRAEEYNENDFENYDSDDDDEQYVDVPNIANSGNQKRDQILNSFGFELP